MPLPVSLRSPKHNTGSTYGQPLGTGVRITFPWIDAGTDSTSIALRVKVDAKDLTSTEEISISYKLNYQKTETTLSNFTSLVSGANRYDTDGLHEATFPDDGTSTEGLEFRAIQFSIGLIADAGDSSVSPDLLSVEFEWYRRPTRKLAFDFTLNMMEPYGGLTPMSQFFALMNSIKNSTTLLELAWHDTTQTQSSITQTYYVDVTSIEMLDDKSGLNYSLKMRIHAEEI